jgi:hypothetical protein
VLYRLSYAGQFPVVIKKVLSRSPRA